jgi:hypothetical protein
MIFNIKCEDQKLKIEADSAVQAIIKIIDFENDILNNAEFEIIKLK